ncbi:hypothetical protein HMI55_004133 [Coelomomyces lativittatus]|nr:hypothetical protein HMI55_004133 [Coelomomyces lativittatus]
MNQFHFLPFSGRIDLKNPQVKFTIFEVYEKDAEIKEPKLIYFGAKLSDSSRHVLSKYALPQRTYLGTTSMDPELSFLMAHLALVRRGDIVYDPCVGTASILLACAHLGAYCYGSDMDGRTIRGISPTQNVLSNYQQYQLQSQMLDHMVAPLQQFRFRIPFCQAVITDPPYGIREQQKKHTVHLQDLFDFAHQALVDYGRLVFVWPYMLSEEKKIPFDSRFAFIDLCIQSFGKWERRIYTYSKTPLLDQVHVSLQELDLSPSYKCNETVKAFRDAYFKPREEKKGSS